jgi:hypothetical protein
MDEHLISKFKSAPKHRMTDVEKQMIFVLVEKARIHRERQVAMLNKGFMIFIIFLAISWVAVTNDIVSAIYGNIVFSIGVIILLITTFNYQHSMSKEEKALDDVLNNFL